MAEGSNTAAKAPKVVRYTGSAERRIISAKDWKSVGAEGQAQVVWDSSNGFKVPVSELSKEAMEYVAKDSGFKVEEA